jgi:hypothetical protein
MPLLGNVLIDFGVGPVSIAGTWSAAPPALWAAITGAGIWGGGVLLALLATGIRRTWSVRRDPGVGLRPWHLAFFGVVAAVLIGPAMVGYSIYFDRYLLPLFCIAPIVAVGPVAAEVDLWAEAGPAARAVAVAGLTLMATWGVVVVHDYLEWNRARLEAARYATNTLGVDPERLDAGFELNNLDHFEKNLYTEGDIDLVPVDPVTRLRLGATHLIAVAPVGGRPVLASYPCRTWSPYSTRRILLVGPPPDDADAPAPARPPGDP